MCKKNLVMGNDFNLKPQSSQFGTQTQICMYTIDKKHIQYQCLQMISTHNPHIRTLGMLRINRSTL